MATIKEDVIHGQRIVVGANGPQRTRVFDFRGLLHGPANDPLAEAYAMLQSLGIDYGEVHNFIPDISVVNIDGGTHNNTPTQARFVVTYGVPLTGDIGGQMLVTVVSATSRQMVRYDKTGKVIKVPFSSTGRVTEEVTVVGEVPKLVAHTVLEFEYERSEPPPLTLTGRKNTTTWQGGSPGQWACILNTGSKIIARTRWRIKQAFEYDPDYWDKAAIYRDPYTGQIPKEVDDVVFTSNEGNGWLRPEVYDGYNFNLLNLPVVYS